MISIYINFRKLVKKKYYNIRYDIFSFLLRNFEFTRLLFGSEDDSTIGKLGRDQFDCYTRKQLKEFQYLKSCGPSVSAVYRVKNGSEYIESAILSIVPLVSEIIIVDNNSTDATVDIVNRLKLTLNELVEIKYYKYDVEIELAGEGYLERVKNNPQGSLSKFYEYCFSLATCDYVIKCDAHVIFFPKGLLYLRRKLLSRPRMIRYTGVEIYGKELNYEPSIFLNDNNFRFIDHDEWEKLEFKIEDSACIKKPIFIHLKRLSYAKYIDVNTSMAAAKYK